MHTCTHAKLQPISTLYIPFLLLADNAGNGCWYAAVSKATVSDPPLIAGGIHNSIGRAQDFAQLIVLLILLQSLCKKSRASRHPADWDLPATLSTYLLCFKLKKPTHDHLHAPSSLPTPSTQEHRNADTSEKLVAVRELQSDRHSCSSLSTFLPRDSLTTTSDRAVQVRTSSCSIQLSRNALQSLQLESPPCLYTPPPSSPPHYIRRRPSPRVSSAQLSHLHAPSSPFTQEHHNANTSAKLVEVRELHHLTFLPRKFINIQRPGGSRQYWFDTHAKERDTTSAPGRNGESWDSRDVLADTGLCGMLTANTTALSYTEGMKNSRWDILHHTPTGRTSCGGNTGNLIISHDCFILFFQAVTNMIPDLPGIWLQVV
eukprot:g60794.t1